MTAAQKLRSADEALDYFLGHEHRHDRAPWDPLVAALERVALLAEADDLTEALRLKTIDRIARDALKEAHR